MVKTASKSLKLSRFVQWFGANAANAHVPAEMLEGCRFVYVPFLGSGCELPHFPPAVQILASDVHDDLITLYRMVQDEDDRGELVARLSGKLFHPAELDRAQRTLATVRERERTTKSVGDLFSHLPAASISADRISDLDIAEAYFTVAWMGRAAVPGTKGEETVGLALRYDAGGGDPVKRYDAAVASLDGWADVLRRCQVTREDVFEVLARLQEKVTDPKFRPEEPGNQIGIYCDPPWPDDGDKYLHRFAEYQQRKLAQKLAEIPHVQVVMRFGDHPLIRDLYPESRWEWFAADGRTQAGKAKQEVFIKRMEF